MSNEKKLVRLRFRDSVFRRDNFTCKGCGHKSLINNAEDELDAHHIINRGLIENQGYVVQNGITLCCIGNNCHLKAENNEQGFSEQELFKLIGSSRKKAIKAAKKLKG